MGWQCVPQVKGLVRGDGMRKDGKGQSKHRANASAIIHEAFLIKDPNTGKPVQVRKSASDTYDVKRTKNNKYTGPMTADDVVEALEEEAVNHPVKVQVKDKETGEIVIRKRALRPEAVIGVAVIYNPPCEVARNWTPEQYDKFFRDCEEVMAQIPFCKMDKKSRPVDGGEHYLLRTENIVAGVEHWDEGEPGDPPVYTGHKHDIYIPADQDGAYHGQLIDALNLSVMVNRMFAPKMRERGWDIDDPDYTEWEDFDTNPTYRAKRKAKIREGGKTVNNHRADKRLNAATEKLNEAQETVNQAVNVLEEANRKDKDADGKIREAERVKQEAIEEKEQARAEAEAMLTDAAEDAGGTIAQVQAEAELDALAAQDIMQLEAEIEAAALLAEVRSDADGIRTAAQAAAAEAGREKAQAEAARDKAKQEAADAVTAKQAAEKDMNAAREQQVLAQMAIEPLTELKARVQEEVEEAKQARDEARSDVEAARAEKTRLEAELADIKPDVEFNKIQLKAQTESIEFYKNQLAEITDQIEGSKAYWNEWFEKIKRDAAEVIDNAKRKAAEIVAAATGEYAFLLKWLAKQTYPSGKTFLDQAREDYQKEIRARREAEMPARVRDAGKGLPGQDGPEKA